MKITIVASVFVAAARPAEPPYLRTCAFIPEAQKANVEAICPTLIPLECGAALVTPMTPDDWLKSQQTKPNQPK
jgi:hypothetical protein